ncbi:hypothetical protein DSO57_1027729 [Entomophthora muscae]|uniref:Uncharacterized protein n=1 Tax=Entomophthora muscae TaxID=34485 RepID=A0ACC2SQN5_9FUNG|nr:hypothetical protein DSO57_1027729 [Entomophthora muscae]
MGHEKSQNYKSYKDYSGGSSRRSDLPRITPIKNQPREGANLPTSPRRPSSYGSASKSREYTETSERHAPREAPKEVENKSKRKHPERREPPRLPVKQTFKSGTSFASSSQKDYVGRNDTVARPRKTPDVISPRSSKYNDSKKLFPHPTAPQAEVSKYRTSPAISSNSRKPSITQGHKAHNSVSHISFHDLFPKPEIYKSPVSKPRMPEPEPEFTYQNIVCPFKQVSDQEMLRLQNNEAQVYETLDREINIEIYKKQVELLEINEQLTIANRLVKYIKKSEGRPKRSKRKRALLDTPGTYNLRASSRATISSLKKAKTKALSLKNALPSRKKVEMGKLFARWEDGVFVRIHCSTCGREDFQDGELLLAHLEKLHNIKFNSLQECYAECGIRVPAHEVPCDHPCRSEPPLSTPPKANSDNGCLSVMYKQFQENKAQLYLEKPKIKIYDEDVDLHTFADALPAVTTAPVPLAMLHEKAKEKDVIQKSKDYQPTDKPMPSKTIPTQKCGSPLIHADLPCPPPLPGQDTSVIARLKLQEASRFHIHKKIIFGNIAKFDTADTNDSEASFFRWLVYLSGPSYAPELSSFISKVTFFLHPSYAPNHIVEVTSPPFQISRRGWGEFPVRAVLTFHDPRNKSIELNHNLTLGSGLEPHESEDTYTIELDRATDFVNPTVAPPPTPSESDDNGFVSPTLTGHSDAVLARLLTSFPIVATTPLPNLTYLPARSTAQLAEMSDALRQQLEWRRAREMLNAYSQETDLTMAPLDLKHLLLWCRFKDPHLVDLVHPPSGYCLVCGKFVSLATDNRCSACKFVCPKLDSSSASKILNTLPPGWDSNSGKHPSP